MPDQFRMHGGPLAGQRIERSGIDTRHLDQGTWPLRMGRFQGHYVRDQGSAGGRDWDWEEEGALPDPALLV